MNHEMFEELLTAQAMGSLSAEEQAALDSHLATGCSSCRELQSALAPVGALLTHAAEPRPVPARVKKNILAEIEVLEGNVRPFPIFRRWMQWSALAAAVVLCGLAIRPLIQMSEVMGEVTEVRGEVRINGKPVSNKTPLRMGQTLVTAPGATTELRLSDKVLIKIKADSQVSIKPVGDGYEVALAKGGAINLVKPGTPYAVVSSFMRVEARGTGFFVNAPATGPLYVCICAGKIELITKDFHKNMEAPHHQAITAEENLTGIAVQPSTLLDHSDEEIALLVSHFK